jgi:hypothetical protein
MACPAAARLLEVDSHTVALQEVQPDQPFHSETGWLHPAQVELAGETAFGILQPSANRPSSKIEKQDLVILLTGPTRTLSFLSRILLRVPIKFLFAVLTAEVIILTLIL